jgi:acetolactate synthase-1/2/3 large subunit
MATYTVGSLVVDCLRANGMDTVFGIVSVHNIPIMDAIAQRPDLRMVMTRGETGAAHMADGFARASGKLGVVISSTGPGAANAVPGLVEARFATTPLLHITGQSATSNLDRGKGSVHDVPDQLGMLSATSKSAYRVRSAQEALATMKRAILDARTPPCGPNSIEIPIDVQRSPVERPDEANLLAAFPVTRAPVEAEIERLAEHVRSAKRPMLWVGAGARHAGAEIEAFLELGFGMVTSWAGHGIVSDDHPLNIGPLNGPGSPAVERLYQDVDLLLVVGSRIRGHEMLDHSCRLPTNLVQIDIDPLADGRTYPNAQFICADCAEVLARLRAKVGNAMRIDRGFREQITSVKKNAASDFRSTLGPYKDFPAELRSVMPRNAVWARDITLSSSTWGHRLFAIHGPRDNIYPVGAGIGQGLQLAIGAAVSGRETVLLTGDGGFLFNMTELWTAVQENVDLTMIVMNDNGYGVIKYMQDAMCDGRRAFGDLLGPDLQRLAALAGIPAWRVSSAEEFGPIAAKAIEARGPTLVEVDMSAIGEFPPYFPYSIMIEKARANQQAALAPAAN